MVFVQEKGIKTGDLCDLIGNEVDLIASHKQSKIPQISF